jgi:hypothetical protein
VEGGRRDRSDRLVKVPGMSEGTWSSFSVLIGMRNRERPISGLLEIEDLFRFSTTRG